MRIRLAVYHTPMARAAPRLSPGAELVWINDNEKMIWKRQVRTRRSPCRIKRKNDVQSWVKIQ